MPSSRSVMYRDVVLALLCVGLLTMPVWYSALHIGDATYRYERVRVTTDGSEIAYATDDVSEFSVPISDEIACSSGWEIRICTFERMVLDQGQVPSEFSHGNPNSSLQPGALDAQYRYVLLNETVYAATYETNTSAPRGDGMHQVNLTLEPISPERALRDVSVPIESPEVPPVVARAARSGNATSHREVSVPETPIRLQDGQIRPGDGRYYRVYLAESGDASTFARVLLPLVGFVAGVLLLLSLSERVELNYVGPTANAGHDTENREQ